MEKLIKPRVIICEKHSEGGDIEGKIDYPDGTSRTASAIAETWRVDPVTQAGSMIFSFQGLPEHLNVQNQVLIVSQQTREMFRSTEELRQNSNLAHLAFRSLTAEEYILGCGFGVHKPFNDDQMIEITNPYLVAR